MELQRHVLFDAVRNYLQEDNLTLKRHFRAKADVNGRHPARGYPSTKNNYPCNFWTMVVRAVSGQDIVKLRTFQHPTRGYLRTQNNSPRNF